MNLKKIALICFLAISSTLVTQQSFADITFDKGRVNFEDVSIWNTEKQTIRISNVGYETVLIVDVKPIFSKDRPMYFNFVNKCSSLFPGESCNIEVYFSPRAPYFTHGRLSIRDSDGSGGYITIDGKGEIQ